MAHLRIVIYEVLDHIVPYTKIIGTSLEPCVVIQLTMVVEAVDNVIKLLNAGCSYKMVPVALGTINDVLQHQNYKDHVEVKVIVDIPEEVQDEVNVNVA